MTSYATYPPGAHRYYPRHYPTGALGRSPMWELALLFATALLVAITTKDLVVQPFFIPSSSMEQTLHGCPGCSGDRILVNKPIYDLRSPHPGDIVVFKAPANWSETPPPKPASNPVLHGLQWAGQLVGLLPPEENDFVKRVIATGGQTVQCCDTQGRVQVSDTGPNGPFHSLNEPYIFQNLPWNPADKPGQPAADGSPEGQSPTDSRTFGPVTVPKGRLWVMGDHRDVSADSRYNFVHQNLGVHDSTIAVNSLIGKAVLIIWPPSRWRTLGTPAGLTQYATGLGGTTAPLLSAAATVIPLGRRRRKKRRNRAA